MYIEDVDLDAHEKAIRERIVKETVRLAGLPRNASTPLRRLAGIAVSRILAASGCGVGEIVRVTAATLKETPYASEGG